MSNQGMERQMDKNMNREGMVESEKIIFCCPILRRLLYENTRCKNQVVTVNMLCFELNQLLAPTEEDIYALPIFN